MVDWRREARFVGIRVAQSKIKGILSVLLILLVPVGAWVGDALYTRAELRRQAEQQRQAMAATFNRIYASGRWAKSKAGDGTSGPGSTLEATREYRAYLGDFLRKHNVQSVVDAGCGDWSFSSAIDWNHVRYLGVDISTSVIEDVTKRFARDNIRFVVDDISRSLPPADLLLCKDVLQHLPNKQVHDFIENNLRKGKYKWAILTNDFGPGNRDIQAGEHRLLDLAAAPFHVRGLVTLPVKFAGEPTKVAQLLDLSQGS